MERLKTKSLYSVLCSASRLAIVLRAAFMPSLRLGYCASSANRAAYRPLTFSRASG